LSGSVKKDETKSGGRDNKEKSKKIKHLPFRRVKMFY